MEQKKNYRFYMLPAFATLLFGVCGGLIRGVELKTCFDASGLPVGGAATNALIVLSLFVVVILAVWIKKDNIRPAESYRDCFGRSSPVAAVLQILAALALSCSGALKIFALWGSDGGFFAMLLAFLEVFSAFVTLALVLGAKDKNAGMLRLVLLLFICLWLIDTFRRCSSDPVILDYIYELFALIFTMLGIYSVAGSSFGIFRLRQTCFFCLLGAYFSIVTLWDTHELYTKLTYVFCALFTLGCSVQLMKKDVK